MLLDPRTHILVNRLSAPEKKVLVNSLRDEYVAFGLKATEATFVLSKYIDRDRPVVEATMINFSGATNTNTDSDNEGDTAELEEDARQKWRAEKTSELVVTFQNEWLKFLDIANAVDWQAYKQEHGFAREGTADYEIPNRRSNIDPVRHLMPLNILPFFKNMPSSLEYLPTMATHSIASLASVCAASFAERINSAGGITVTKGNVLLATAEVAALVPQRINRAFTASELLESK